MAVPTSNPLPTWHLNLTRTMADVMRDDERIRRRRFRDAARKAAKASGGSRGSNPMTLHARVADNITRIVLPMPPSANNMFVNVKRVGRVRSPDYRRWQTEAGWLLKSQHPRKFYEPVRVKVELCPQNGRAFDIDNRNKALLDLLVEHQIIPDDSWKWVRGISTEIVRNGAACTVTVEAA